MDAPIGTLSSQIVQDQGNQYKQYHAEFIQKSIFEKLWLIARGMCNHIYYSWFAPAEQRQIYFGLLSYLKRKQ